MSDVRCEKIQMAITQQRVIWFSGSRVGILGGGSIGAISVWIKSKMAAGGYVKKFQASFDRLRVWF